MRCIDIFARICENGQSVCWLALHERKLPATVRVLGLLLCTHGVFFYKKNQQVLVSGLVSFFFYYG
jgi:hypothetical protein